MQFSYDLLRPSTLESHIDALLDTLEEAKDEPRDTEQLTGELLNCVEAHWVLGVDLPEKTKSAIRATLEDWMSTFVPEDGKNGE